MLGLHPISLNLAFIAVHFVEPAHADSGVLFPAQIIPDRVQREILAFVQHGHPLAEISGIFRLAHQRCRFQQRGEQRLSRGAETDDPCRDAIDLRVEEVQSDGDALI